MLSYDTIFTIMMQLLASDNAQNIDTPHIKRMATAIHKHQSTTVSAHTLIAVSYVEDRFSYDGFSGVNGAGACGPYQQIPKWAHESVTCEDLKDEDTATRVAVSSIKWFYKTKGEKLDTLCHYNSGMECNADSLKYAEDVKKAFRRSKSLAMKTSRGNLVSFGKKTPATKLSPKERALKKFYLDTGMWEHTDDATRARLGLPPSSI